MSIVQELKRRNVFRVAILFLVASWLILQVVDVGISLLGLPEMTGRFIFLILAISFPLVVVFSWVYEITPDGIRKERGVIRSDSIAHLTARKLDVAVIVLLFLAIGIVVTDRLNPKAPVVAEVDPPVPAVTAVDNRSIAVLPFLDLSQNQDHQYFSDGLSEELLNLLVRVESLTVASRTSSFVYRDRTMGIPEIAKALNVAHVLEGSVRKDGNRIRITAQLIETATDRHLWSENFNRNFEDIFAIQDEIANAIVNALVGEMGIGGGRAVIVDVPTEILEAYESYLEARELFTQRRNLPESIRLFRRAVELDPDFARAWEGLAAVEIIADDWLYGVKDDGVDHSLLAKEAADKAISLDPELSMPLAVLGMYSSRILNDLVAALEYFDAAIQKDPNNASAWQWTGGIFKYAGYLDDAIMAFEQCIAIDPARIICRDYLAETYLFNGMPDKALALHSEVLERNYRATAPSFVSIYVRNGNRDLALDIADAKMDSVGAPVIEWIRAIENPDTDNSAGLARLKDWTRQMDGIIELPPQMLFSFKAYDEMLEIGEMQRRMLFHPDAEEFRRTPQFKEIVRERGIFALWEGRGYPPACRAVDDDDFECGLPIAE